MVFVTKEGYQHLGACRRFIIGYLFAIFNHYTRLKQCLVLCSWVKFGLYLVFTPSNIMARYERGGKNERKKPLQIKDFRFFYISGFPRFGVCLGFIIGFFVLWVLGYLLSLRNRLIRKKR